jgi:ribosomal protein S6
MKEVSHKVVENGGIIRSIQNHGIRDLPHRFRAKYPDREGNRYFKKGRFVSIFYDSNPQTMRQVEDILRMNEEVLRNTHLKARNKLWYVNIAREDKNPYIKKVIAMERREQATKENES